MRERKYTGKVMLALFTTVCMHVSAHAATYADVVQISVPPTKSNIQQSEALTSLGYAPDGARIRKPNAPDVNCPSDTIVATGDLLVESDGTIRPIAVRGDIIGNGQLGLSQIVRLAQASIGKVHLDGVMLTAGDYDGNGRITVSDLVAMAKQVKSVSPETPPPAPSESTRPTATFDANGFIFADSSTRLLTDAELAELDATALGFARNEIFARNGNIFRSDKYANHYGSYSWYNGLQNKRYDVMPADLNDIERANVQLIQHYESLLDGRPGEQPTSWYDGISQNEADLTAYVLSHTFRNASDDVLTFKLNVDRPWLLESYINGRFDHTGWNYGPQYGGFSSKATPARMLCIVDSGGAVSYESPHHSHKGLYYPA